MEETAPHSGLLVDTNVLASAWSSSDEDSPAGIDVEALAAAWDSEGSASTRQGDTGQVATQSRQELTIDVAQLAAVWSSSDEDSDEESASPTSSSGESDNATMALDLAQVSSYLSLADISNALFSSLHRQILVQRRRSLLDRIQRHPLMIFPTNGWPGCDLDCHHYILFDI